MLAFIELKFGRSKNPLLTQTLPVVGLFLIAHSILFFNENTPHPSFQTLIPIVGVALILTFCSTEDFVGKLLSFKPVVSIGLISYSLYLWHFPIFAFGRIGSPSPSTYDKVRWILLSIFLSILSFYIIEKPFRKRTKLISINVNVILLSAFMILLIFFSVFVSTFKSKFWESIYPEHLLMANTILKTEDNWAFKNESTCILNFTVTKYEGATQDLSEWEERFGICVQDSEPVVLVIGDSHGMNIFDVFAHSKRFSRVFGMTNDGCNAHRCKVFNYYEYFLNEISPVLRPQDIVVYHQAGDHFIMDSGGNYLSNRMYLGNKKYSISYSDENAFSVRDYLNRISNLTKANVIWLGPFWDNGLIKSEVIKQIKSDIYTSFDITIHSSIIEYNDLLNDVLNHISRKQKYLFLPFNEFHEQVPNGFVSLSDSSRCFQFRDNDHFSNCGELYISENMEYWEEKYLFGGNKE